MASKVSGQEQQHRLQQKQNLFYYSLAGSCGGLTVAVFTNPIDVIKTRLQTQISTYGETRIWPLVQKLYTREGLYVFSKGVGARIGLLVLEGIVFADFYELLMHFSSK
eukprot:125877_1